MSSQNQSNIDALTGGLDLEIPIEYHNELPEVLFDIKRFPHQYTLDKYMNNKVPTFAKHIKNEHIINCNHVLGIDFMRMEKYNEIEDVELDEEDSKLLVDTKSESTLEEVKQINHSKNVSWLRKSEYITADYSKGSKNNDAFDKKLVQNAQNYQLSAINLKSAQSQKDAINQTFIDAKIDPKLHTKKGNLEPVEILSVLPKSLPSNTKCALVTFDGHPTSYGANKFIEESEMVNGLLRGTIDDQGEFVGYYLPKKLQVPLKNHDLENAEQFELLREYNWNVNITGTQTFEDIYVFTKVGDVMNYAPLPTKIKLVKRVVRKSAETSNLNENTLLVLEDVKESESP